MSNVKDTKILTLTGAKAIAAAAESEAISNGWGVSIAIVDAGGHLLHLQRLDGAGPGTAVAATCKARTAAIFCFETGALESMVKEGRTAVISLPDMVPLQGGVPITVDGVVIGGVGVSGVQSHDDEHVAKVGIEALM
tara:strand:+ start:100 stop:510 length:411 start_codon:yes stop_codon:yes gene_type:complete